MGASHPSVHFVNHPRIPFTTNLSPPYIHQVYYNLLCSASSATIPDTRSNIQASLQHNYPTSTADFVLRRLTQTSTTNPPPKKSPFSSLSPNRELRPQLFQTRPTSPDMVIKEQPGRRDTYTHTPIPPASSFLSLPLPYTTKGARTRPSLS